MTARAYRFVTEWEMVGTAREVADVLADPLELPRWWPSVYLAVEELEAGGEHGLGRRARVLTKGWLPHTLSWCFSIVESRYPHGFTLEADGDLLGRGVWTFTERGVWVHVTYDWQVVAQKPLLRLLSPIARPALAANHRWAMRQGEESLKLELTRRRAGSDLERALVAAPPRPTTTSPVPLLLAAVGVAGAVVAVTRLIVRTARPRRRAGRERRS